MLSYGNNLLDRRGNVWGGGECWGGGCPGGGECWETINPFEFVGTMRILKCMKYNYSSRLVADSEYTKNIMIGLLVKNVLE